MGETMSRPIIYPSRDWMTRRLFRGLIDTMKGSSHQERRQYQRPRGDFIVGIVRPKFDVALKDGGGRQAHSRAEREIQRRDSHSWR
jgi:hypothetical protein